MPVKIKVFKKIGFTMGPAPITGFLGIPQDRKCGLVSAARRTVIEIL
jgi:hypothetical protein